MKIVIFDMDGTLLDSKKDITISVNYIRKLHHNLEPLSEEYIVEVINMEDRNLSKLFYDTDIYLEKDRKLFEVHYKQQCIKNPYLYDGIFKLLKNLKESNVKLSVATNAPTTFAIMMLTHLKIIDMFDMVIGSDKVTLSKPNPEMIDKILEFYSFDKVKHKAWMVGDSYKDMKSAENAGIESIFALWGFTLETTHKIKFYKPMDIINIVL